MSVRGEQDDLTTVVAVGLLAYASADIAHHVFGHGAACLALGALIRSLSSVYVDCSLRGAAIDLAGPLANLLIGLLAVVLSLRAHGATRLFLALAAGFNLFWCTGQLIYGAVTVKDDFGWPLVVLGLPPLARYALAAVSLGLYRIMMRWVARLLTPYGATRARRIVLAAWLTAGLLAAVTALRDAHPLPAILHYALPQSLVLSVGLLFLPRLTVDGDTAPPLTFGTGWMAAALVVAGLSILFLGPGFAVGQAKPAHNSTSRAASLSTVLAYNGPKGYWRVSIR